ncbi:hypothetical protein SAMN05660443_2462 [Marinospirillum celere]|uniref:Outer membrane protein beta-barrel domain-containing protein n=1 Tax=Marinospirillum celere TaxID=1122252 RepID=A0A1I1IR13_9GAMM|nr:hypothetical protein [Marinospirillum celere]SFC38676.1 hypothetical protein SAMN05660443_2462 [Marinospirillum celere]
MDKSTPLPLLFPVKSLAAGLAFAFISTPLYAECSAAERAEMIRAGLTAQEVKEVCPPIAESQPASESQSQPTRRSQATPQSKEVELKRFQIGLASYSSAISHTGWWDDYAFSGLAFFASIAFNDNVAIRGLIASTEEKDDTSLSMDTGEVSLLLGTGLATRGGKFYASIGYFNDEVSSKTSYYDWYWDEYYTDSADYEFSGLQFGIGGGYNWTHIALDLWLNIKDSTDFEDMFGVEAAAVSAGLGISGRF